MSQDLRWLDALISGEPPAEADALPTLEAFHSLGATSPRLTPWESLRARLLSAVEAQPFAPFTDRLAALFDLSAARVSQLLAALIDASSWMTLCPGVALMHVEGGPNTVDADVGFVRVDPGLTFPSHEHLGQEQVLILQGELEDHDGTRHGPGEVLVAAHGSAHTVRSVGTTPLIWAVVVYGVQFDPFESPDDP